jgi:uncharacterized protein
VRVRARARRTEIAGERGGAILVRLAAPPVEGKANAALCRLIAERAGLSRRSVTIVRGERSRDKLLRVEGVDEAALRRALGLPTQPPRPG